MAQPKTSTGTKQRRATKRRSSATVQPVVGPDWSETFDDDDNSIWEAASPYTSDSDPKAVPDIHWRLKQRLRDNQIEWYEAHDAELMHRDGADCWPTLEEAKKAIADAHAIVLIEYQNA